MAMYGASVEDLRLLARHFEQQSGLLTDSVLHPLDYFVRNAAWVSTDTRSASVRSGHRAEQP